MKDGEKGKTFSAKIKKLIGVEEGTKLKPMIAYNSAIFFTGGGPYVLGSYLLPFLTHVEGLSTEQYGTVALFSCICDAITDPIMGLITDRTKSKLGRHRPYLILGVIPAMVSYFLMWNSFGISAAGNSTKTMWWYVFTYMLYKTVSTFITVPHTAMLAQIAPSYNLRTQFNAVKTILDAVASYSSFFISAMILGGINGLITTPDFSPEYRTRFAVMGAVLCLWTSLPLIFTFKGTSEESSKEQVNEPLNVKEFFSQYVWVIKNRIFRKYFLFGFFVLLSSAFVSQCFYYFLVTVLGQQKDYSMLVMICGIGEAAGFLPAYFFSVKKSKQLPAKVFVPVAVVSLILAWVARTSGSPIIIFIVEFFYGVGLAGMASVQSNILPDVTDVDEMITGQRREGVISTFSTFVKKFVSGFAAFGIGKILAAFGYNTQLRDVPQGESAVFGVSLCFTVLPVCFLTLAFLSIFTYDLTREKHAFIKEKVAFKHEHGYVDLTEEEKKTVEKIAGMKLEKMWLGKREEVSFSERQ